MESLIIKMKLIPRENPQIIKSIIQKIRLSVIPKVTFNKKKIIMKSKLK